jgi:hypothetical protein
MFRHEAEDIAAEAEESMHTSDKDDRMTAACPGMPLRQIPYTHSFACMSALTPQLQSLSSTLRTNAYYIYSEAAPEAARSGLSSAQLAAFPSLYAAPGPAPPGADVQVTELSTLGGESLVIMCRKVAVYFSTSRDLLSV